LSRPAGVPALHPLLRRRLLLVTGKGGTGKTVVAAALARLASRRVAVLVAEAEPVGDLADALGVPALGPDAVPVAPDLAAFAVHTEAAIREYVERELRLPLVTRLGPVARSLDFLAVAAPGVREVLVIGKIADEVRRERADLVVLDGPASGQAVGQLGVTGAIHDAVAVGPVRAQTAWMLDLLTDPEVTGVVVVATPEELAVTETLELVDRLADTGVDLAAVVVNRLPSTPFGRAEQEALDALGPDRLRSVVGPGADTLVRAAHHVLTRQRAARHELDRLLAGLPPDVPLVVLPEVALGPRVGVVDALATALAEELVVS
jgi:anion-transporting  ArsA/GET3 family ATPase